MNKPIISVIIPCFNQGGYLLELLDCFPNYQDQSIYEIIIVDDGSSDEYTISVFSELEKNGMHIIHQNNKGVCVARNVGIRSAIGKYIFAIDGDDKICIEFIYKVIEIFENNPEFSVIYANGEYFGSKEGPWNVGEFNLQRLMLWNYLPSGSAFRKAAWEQVNGFDSKAGGLEDWDFWLSIAFNGGKFYYLEKSLFSYRVLPNSTIRSVTTGKYRILLDYLENKHQSFLGNEHLSNHFALKFKNNKKLWMKLFLKIYFPKFLNKLVSRGSLDSNKLN
ncbi:MAG: glycosyltransferase family A protein [Bacteroidota bacterium]